MSKKNIMHVLYLHLEWPNYDLDVLNITMHMEVVIHSMNAYVWCWSQLCGSLDEIPSVTMGSCKRKFLMNSNMTLTVYQKTEPKVQQDFKGINFLHLTVSEIQPGQNFIGQGHYSKVKGQIKVTP